MSYRGIPPKGKPGAPPPLPPKKTGPQRPGPPPPIPQNKTANERRPGPPPPVPPQNKSWQKPGINVSAAISAFNASSTKNLFKKPSKQTSINLGFRESGGAPSSKPPVPPAAHKLPTHHSQPLKPSIPPPVPSKQNGAMPNLISQLNSKLKNDANGNNHGRPLPPSPPVPTSNNNKSKPPPPPVPMNNKHNSRPLPPSPPVPTNNNIKSKPPPPPVPMNNKHNSRPLPPVPTNNNNKSKPPPPPVPTNNNNESKPSPPPVPTNNNNESKPSPPPVMNRTESIEGRKSGNHSSKKSDTISSTIKKFFNSNTNDNRNVPSTSWKRQTSDMGRDSVFTNDALEIELQNTTAKFNIVVHKTLSHYPAQVVLDLESCRVIIIRESGGKKSSDAKAYLNVTRSSSDPDTLTVSLKEKMLTRERRYQFHSDEAASKFQKMVLALADCGAQLREIFAAMDFSGNGSISEVELRRVIRNEGFLFSAQMLTQMCLLANPDYAMNGINLEAFFELFMNTPVYTVPQCLMEWRNKVISLQSGKELNGKTKVAGLSTFQAIRDPINLVGGEFEQYVNQNVRYSFTFNKDATVYVGTMTITNYRIILRPYLTSQELRGTKHEIPPAFDEVSIPLTTLLKVESAKGKNSSLSVKLYSKDTREMLLIPEGSSKVVETLIQVIQTFCFPNDPRSYFAFFYECENQGGINGWHLYDSEKEFKRQGLIPSELWRLYDNRYQLSETYPGRFIIPIYMTEKEIAAAAKFRSKNRLPVVTYYSRATGALISRSSQPMTGLNRARSSEDEKLLNLIRLKGHLTDPNDVDDPSNIYIIDCRKLLAATGNQFKGKGVENANNYENCSLKFCNIENIHTMRNSITNLGDAIANTSDNDSHWNSKIEESGWFRHVRLVLAGSLLVAEKIFLEGASVLVHCSDGWDRTAQLCATSQILLDPYFRTIKGLAVLIEKDWLSFGHKFQQRAAHGDNSGSQERSPVFIQFLDALHQIMNQFPSSFEYNEDLLIFIADHLHSCLFGTFIGNSDKERVQTYRVHENTQSIWTYVYNNLNQFINQEYEMLDRPLWPRFTIKKIKLWERYFCRWFPSMHPLACTGNWWLDDWGAGKNVDSMEESKVSLASPAFPRRSYMGFKSSSGKSNKSSGPQIPTNQSNENNRLNSSSSNMPSIPNHNQSRPGGVPHPKGRLPPKRKSSPGRKPPSFVPPPQHKHSASANNNGNERDSGKHPSYANRPLPKLP